MQRDRVSVQGVKSLGGHFACLCRGFEFYEVKKIFFFVITFQKENGNKVQWADLTCDVIKKLTPFVLSKL